MTRVLLLEDEPVLRGSMARGLGKLPSTQVLEAGNLAEALACIDASAPDAIISDIDLPGRTGLELIGELRRRGLTTPILYVSAYLKAYRSQIPPNAQVDILEKPVPLEQLRNWVVEHVKASPATGGRAPFSAADYLQLACMGRHSLEILVDAGPAGPARIVIVKGEVWSAQDGGGGGVGAFKRAVFQAQGAVECRVLEGLPGPKNIDKPWEALLMDAARELDEAQRDELEVSAGDLEGAAAGHEPGPEPLPPPEPEPAAAAPAVSDDERFATAWDRGIAALLAKDFPAALSAFLDARALRPDDPRVAANLKRLEDLGFVQASSEEG